MNSQKLETQKRFPIMNRITNTLSRNLFPVYCSIHIVRIKTFMKASDLYTLLMCMMQISKKISSKWHSFVWISSWTHCLILRIVKIAGVHIKLFVFYFICIAINFHVAMYVVHVSAACRQIVLQVKVNGIPIRNTQNVLMFWLFQICFISLCLCWHLNLWLQADNSK